MKGPLKGTQALVGQTQQRAAGAPALLVRADGHDGQVPCDTMSHALSELVEEVWLMPGT